MGLTEGVGCTITLKVRAGPSQPNALALTLTVLVIAVVPLLVTVKAGMSPEPDVPKPTLLVAVQVYDAPATLLPKEIAVAFTPLQRSLSAIALTTGLGLTVTTRLNVLPAQPCPEVELIVYVADSCETVGLLSVCTTEACAEPVEPPVIPPVTLGEPQVYVVPAGTIVAAVGIPF